MRKDTPYNEQDLLLRLANGDTSAFNEIYQLFYRPLCYFSYTITQHMPQSEDIASIALTKLWDKKQDFNSISSIKSFLYTTTRNASLDYLKSLKVRSAAASSLLEQSSVSEDQLMANQLEAQLLKHIYDAVENLPPKARQIFKMIYIEGLSTEAIAEKLNMPVQTVRNNKTRAIELLKLDLLKKNILPIWLIAQLF